MTMCLKLAYCAFSSSPSEDARMSTFSVFSTLFFKFKLFDEFFPLEKRDCNSLKLSLHFSSVPFPKDGRIGRFRGFSSLVVEAINRLKFDGQSLFFMLLFSVLLLFLLCVHVWKVISYSKGMSRAGNMCLLQITTTKIYIIYVYSLGQLERL